jgi:intracellular multiplication protein IcmK
MIVRSIIIILLLGACQWALVARGGQAPQTGASTAQAFDQAEQLRQLQQLQQLQQQQQRQLQQQMQMPEQADEAQAMPPTGQAPLTAQPPQATAPAVAAQPPRTTTPRRIVPEMDSKSAVDEAAFRETLRDTFPLTPEQILRLREIYQATQFAEQTTPGTPPRPTATSQMVNLEPGATPPVIRLSQGFVSSLVFVDSTGAPWPIASYDLGDPTSFNVQWDKTSNMLMIQANQLYTYGNLAVRLRDLNTPVMLTLVPGQKAVDYRVDLRLQGFGPNASQVPMGTGLPPHATDILLSVLDGVPPPNGKRLTIEGGHAEAWEQDNKIYLRTRLTILSPGWIATMASADGMRAYELPKSPILLVSHHGKINQLRVEGL